MAILVDNEAMKLQVNIANELESYQPGGANDGQVPDVEAILEKMTGGYKNDWFKDYPTVTTGITKGDIKIEVTEYFRDHNEPPFMSTVAATKGNKLVEDTGIITIGGE